MNEPLFPLSRLEAVDDGGLRKLDQEFSGPMCDARRAGVRSHVDAFEEPLAGIRGCPARMPMQWKDGSHRASHEQDTAQTVALSLLPVATRSSSRSLVLQR